MPDDDGALAQALPARGAYVLLSEDVQQARAHLPQIERKATRRERRGGKDEVPKVRPRILHERHVAAGREDAAGNDIGEEQDEDDPEEEERIRQALGALVAARAGDDADLLRAASDRVNRETEHLAEILMDSALRESLRDRRVIPRANVGVAPERT